MKNIVATDKHRSTQEKQETCENLCKSVAEKIQEKQL
jgi:hypothetical protein